MVFPGDENRVLARTPHIQEAVALVSRGLRQVFDQGMTMHEAPA